MGSRSIFSILVRIRRFKPPIFGTRHCTTPPVKPTIGFIGTGNMGSHMVKNLILNSYPLIVYDIQPEATADLGKLGAKVAASAAELTSQADRVITMLPADADVRKIYSGCEGIFKASKPGTIFMDSSSVDPETSKEMSNLAKAKATTYLDCPVSGGVTAARDGTLIFMVGGHQDEYKEVESILLDMGAKTLHCGTVGSGQVAQICNNMLLGISMMGTAEAMNLGVKMGLDAKLLAEILNSGTGRCWSSELNNPVPGVLPGVPSSEKYRGGLRTELMTKDLRLAQMAASRESTATPLGAMAHQIYQMMCSLGFRSKDYSSIYLYLQEFIMSRNEEKDKSVSKTDSTVLRDEECKKVQAK